MGIWVLRIMFNPSSYFNKRLLDLNSAMYLNTYRRVDWNEVINILPDEGVEVTTDPTRWKLDTPGYTEIYKMWQDANFNIASIKWTNYYPEKHFSKTIIDDIASYLRLNGVHRSWISRVDPGYFAPLHWDVDDNEDEYMKHGEIFRYSILLGEPTHGHIFILGDDYIFEAPRGSIFKWKNYKDWHSGINAGMKPKFMLHFLGY